MEEVKSYEKDGHLVTIRPNGTKRVTLIKSGNSLVEQHHKQICDINHIVRRFRKTGLIDHVSNLQARYDDFTGVGSYHECMNKLVQAEEAFLQLPAEVRKEFQNDPGIMLDEIQKPENYDRMVELGLLARRKLDVVSDPAQAGEHSSAQSST